MEMKRLVCLALLVAGCSSSTGSTPTSVDGTWVFQVLNSGCPEVIGIANGSDGLQAEVFNVTQTGQQVAAQFVDNGGNDCSLSGTYVPDQFRGTLTVEESEGRTLVLSAEGIARAFGSRRQVDGWARVEQDTFGDCEGAIIEFCAVIQGEGDQTPAPPPPPPQLCPVDIVFLLTTGDGNAEMGEAFCSQIASIESLLLANDIDARTTLLGVQADRDNLRSEYACLEDNVKDLLGDVVPGTPPPGHGVINDESDWGGAGAIVADRFPWQADHIRILVPISPEGPEKPGGDCDTDDDQSASNLIVAANTKQVVVSPIMLFRGQDSCVFGHYSAVASDTGGIAQQTADPFADLPGFVVNLVLDACETRDIPPDIPPSPEPPPPPPPDEVGELLAQCPIFVVFLVDTSLSMVDDIEALDAAVDTVIEELNALAESAGGQFVINGAILGITENGEEARARINADLAVFNALLAQVGLQIPPPPPDAFDLLEDSLINSEATTAVPLAPGFENPTFADPITSGPLGFGFESWGSGVAITAALLDSTLAEPSLQEDFVLVIVPMFDEGPEEGLSGEMFTIPPPFAPPPGLTVNIADRGTCDQADTDSVSNAIAVANVANVIVSPIVGFLQDSVSQLLNIPGSFNECAIAEGQRLADATGGTLQRVTEPATDMAQALRDLLIEACREGAERRRD